MQTYTSHSEDETKRIAAAFAETLHGGEVVELIGDLGAGKTAFVRGVAEALGAKVRVKSPTFTVMNEYPISYGRIGRIIHLDLYRFTTPEELEALELEEYKRPDTIIFVEWPNVFDVPIFKNAKRVEMTHVGENERKIVIKK